VVDMPCSVLTSEFQLGSFNCHHSQSAGKKGVGSCVHLCVEEARHSKCCCCMASHSYLVSVWHGLPRGHGVKTSIPSGSQCGQAGSSIPEVVCYAPAPDDPAMAYVLHVVLVGTVAGGGRNTCWCAAHCR
jgi:hypothetical protein